MRPPLRNTTRSTPHLGEPLAAATARGRRRRSHQEVTRPVPLGDGAGEGGPLGAHPERVCGVLDVAALDDVPVARQHGATDVEPRVRRVRVRSGSVRPGEELVVGDRHEAEKTWKIVSVTSAPIRPPTTTSAVECTPDSTRVCATSNAMMNARDETRKR